MIQYMFGSKKYHCWLVVVDYFIKEITLMNRLQETIKINKTFTLKSITVTLLWFISIRKAFLMHCTFSMRLSILWQRIQTWPYEKCTCRTPKRRDGQVRMSHVCHTPPLDPSLHVSHFLSAASMLAVLRRDGKSFCSQRPRCRQSCHNTGFRGNRSALMGPGLLGSGPQQLNELSVNFLQTFFGVFKHFLKCLENVMMKKLETEG